MPCSTVSPVARSTKSEHFKGRITYPPISKPENPARAYLVGYSLYKLHKMGNNERPGGTRWGSLLRHCATRRKVAGSIPDDVIGIFHLHNSSGRIMALGLAQPLTEMSTRNISWGVKAAGA